MSSEVATWRQLQDQGVEATLDRVEHLHAARVAAEAELFELATLFADQMSGHELPTETDPAAPGGSGVSGSVVRARREWRSSRVRSSERACSSGPGPRAT